MVNDSLTTIFLPWSINRHGSFCHGFFDFRGRRVSSTTKICAVVEGIRPAFKMLTSSEVTRGNQRLLAGYIVFFLTTTVNPW
jgi:hypothetical protein